MKPACSHPVILKNLCAVCGMKIDASSSSFSSLTVAGGSVMRLSVEEANRVQQSKTSTLQRSRKLALVLDIDHTMLHAVQVEGPTPPEGQRAHMNGELHHLPIEEVHEGQKRHLVIKKRPYLDIFLEEANKLFQLSIYTAGTRRYAEAVVRVIDPKGAYISNRIVSRSDVPGGAAAALDKSLDRIFLNDASMAVVLDDREDVWRGPQQQQLLLVRPYEYFLPNSAASRSVGAVRGGQGEVNNAPGQRSLANSANDGEKDTEVMPIIALHSPHPGAILGHAPRSSVQFCEADDQLQRSLFLLQKLHASFYPPSSASNSASAALSANQKSVSTELSSLKAMALSSCGVGICLPHAIDDSRQLSPPKMAWFNMLRALAEALGARPAILVPSSVAGRIARGDYRANGNDNGNTSSGSNSSESQQGQWKHITHLLALQPPPPSPSSNTSASRESNTNEGSKDNKVWLLHVDWLFFCRWSLAKASESPFQLLLSSASASPPHDDSSAAAAAATAAVVAAAATAAVVADGSNTSPCRKRKAEDDGNEDSNDGAMAADDSNGDGGEEECKELLELQLQSAKRRKLASGTSSTMTSSTIAPVTAVTEDQDEFEESDSDEEDGDGDGEDNNNDYDSRPNDDDNYNDNDDDNDSEGEEAEESETPLPSQEDEEENIHGDSSDDGEDDFSMLETILLNRKTSNG